MRVSSCEQHPTAPTGGALIHLFAADRRVKKKGVDGVYVGNYGAPEGTLKGKKAFEVKIKN